MECTQPTPDDCQHRSGEKNAKEMQIRIPQEEIYSVKENNIETGKKLEILTKQECEKENCKGREKDNKTELDLILFSSYHPDVLESLIAYDNKALITELCKYKLLNMPMISSIWYHSPKRLTNHDIGRLICIKAKIMRAEKPLFREIEKQFKCSKCGIIVTAKTDIRMLNEYDHPPCTGIFKGKDTAFNKYNKKQDKPHICYSTKYEAVKDTVVYTNYQEIKLGNYKSSITVLLHGDQTGKYYTGDIISVIGTVEFKANEIYKGKRVNMDMVLIANSVKVIKKYPEMPEFDTIYRHITSKGQDIMNLRAVLVRAFAPCIIHREEEKLGLLLSLVCGNKMSCEDYSLRGSIHVLLLGEAGTGKTKLIRYANRVASRSLWINGAGCTLAGLTIAAMKIHSKWTLQPGVLVLSDGGTLCIDDFHLMKKSDRDAIHEAMEQQTVSIAKAGMVCQANARATIIASASLHKGNKYDFSKDIEWNTGFSVSLLTRFDLVFTLVDNYEPTIFEDIMYMQEPIFNAQDMMRYLGRARKLTPTLSEGCQLVLTNYYVYIRSNEFVEKDRKTPRFLQGALRLTEAHAKLMMREKALVQDAVLIVYLIECTLRTGMIESNEFVYSMEHYAEIEAQCFKALEIDKNKIRDYFLGRSLAPMLSLIFFSLALLSASFSVLIPSFVPFIAK